MTKSRQIVLIGSAALVILLIASWFLLLSPRLSKVSDLNTERQGVETANVTKQQDITELQKLKDNIGSAQTEAATLADKFPATAAQSELFQVVKDAAAKAGLPESAVSDLTVGVPQVGANTGSVGLAPAATAAPAATDGTSTDTASSDPSAAASAGTGATGTSVPPTSGQLGSMTLDLSVSGSRDQIVAFLSALENSNRAVLVSSVAYGAGTGDAPATATISGTMYLLPALVDPTQPSASASPSADASVAPSASPTTAP